jgi:GAF domain
LTLRRELLGELQERTADLARSVDELTATSDVLKIISRSTVDLETVLDTLVDTVTRLCRADHTFMFRRRDDKYYLVAACGLSEEEKEFILTHPMSTDRGTLTGRVMMERRAVHIADVLQDPAYTYHELQKILGYRSMLGVPLLRGDELLRRYLGNGNQYRITPLGLADDDRAANGSTVLDYAQAQAKARAMIDLPGGDKVHRLTVRQAFARYVEYKRSLGASVADVMSRGTLND